MNKEIFVFTEKLNKSDFILRTGLNEQTIKDILRTDMMNIHMEGAPTYVNSLYQVIYNN